MYNIEYENEKNFKQLERSLKKYSIPAYKELMFKHLPNLRSGNFEDAIVNEEGYEIVLTIDKMFEKVNGKCKLVFKIENNSVILLDIVPNKILLEGHNPELLTYKGVLISKDNKEKEMFRINLLNMIDKYH